MVCYVATDPREWSRDDVHNWLRMMKSVYNVDDIHLDRFMMNGKGLCVISRRVEMFRERVPDAGDVLHRDFVARFLRVLQLPKTAASCDQQATI